MVQVFMKGLFSQQITEFAEHWRNYVFQSAFATLVVFAFLWLLRAENLIIVASLGSTAFVVFAMPKTLTAQPRNVIGGQLIGLGCGALGFLAEGAGLPFLSAPVVEVGVYAIAVGLSIFLMVVLDMEHPPASGTALGIATQGFSMPVLPVVVAGSVLMSLVHYLTRRWLRNLA